MAVKWRRDSEEGGARLENMRVKNDLLLDGGAAMSGLRSAAWSFGWTRRLTSSGS